MDFETERCVRCGRYLRDINLFENDKPVILEKGQELCSLCYKDYVDQYTQ